MSYDNPIFPESVWDGLTSNTDRVDLNANVDPNAADWERIAPEVIAIQEYLTTPGGQIAAIGGTLENATLTTDDHTALLDAQLGARVVNLPSAVGIDGQIFIVKKVDATGNTVTIDPAGAELIDGAATKVISTQNDVVTIQAYNGNWFIIS